MRKLIVALVIALVGVLFGCSDSGNTMVQTDTDPLSAILYTRVAEPESTSDVREEFADLFDNVIYDNAIYDNQAEKKSEADITADSKESLEESEPAEAAAVFAYADTDSDTDTETVWIPASGKKYHIKPDCSGMKNPSAVSKSRAELDGYTKCKRCFK